MHQQQNLDIAMLNPAYFPYWNKPEILWNDHDRTAAEAGHENFLTPVPPPMTAEGWYRG